MDKNNIHLEIANALLDDRELSENISRAIYYSLDALDAQLQRMIQQEINNCKYYDGDLHSIQDYLHKRMNELMVLAGVYTFNPNGCSGEQTYKFIQEFTQVSSVETKVGDIAHASHFTNYSQGEFNALTDDNSEDYYTEKCYHEFTASGGCRD